MGIADIQKLKSLDKLVDVHHVFFPFFYEFPYFRLLDKPIVFSSTTSKKSQIAGSSKKNITYLSSNSSVIDNLAKNGIENAHHVISGIEVDKWSAEKALPNNERFSLLMASAPHTRVQFESKGILLLLDYLTEQHDLNLTLLWRGVETQYMRRLIAQYNLENRVNLVDRRVDVQRYLNESHATILLCDEPGVIKNYPHSLIESICCGRPVIMSQLSELSDTVKNNQLGVVLEQSRKHKLHESMLELRMNYSTYQQNCMTLDKSLFDYKSYIEMLKKIYQSSMCTGTKKKLG